MSDRRQRRGRANADRVVRIWSKATNLHSVAIWILRDQRSGDQLRDVLAGLVSQIVLLGQCEEQVVPGGSLEVICVPRETASDASRSAVIGGGSEIQRPELLA